MAPQRKFTVLQIVQVILLCINIPFMGYLAGSFKHFYDWTHTVDNRLDANKEAINDLKTVTIPEIKKIIESQTILISHEQGENYDLEKRIIPLEIFIKKTN